MHAVLTKSLYERLGGAEAIRGIIDDAIDLHLESPVIAPRFRNTDLGKLKRLGHEFFCAGAGGPECYSGREMRAAHEGMNISEQEYLAVMDDIVAAMTRHEVAPAERDEVIAILFALKNDVIRA
jgi:hemoglobin